MHTLRGILQSRKLTLYILLPLLAASILTIMNSRSTYAESPSLLGTVRCLVRTVLSVECPSMVTTAPAQPSNTPQQSQAPAPSSQTPATKSAQESTKTPPVTGETVTLPEQTIAEYEKIEQIPHSRASSPRIPESEYVAYFNQYSPYAVAGAQDQKVAPVEQTSEGWRLLGVAWYWWAAGVLIIFTIFLSVKRQNLRKSSVLPEHTQSAKVRQNT